LAVIKIDTVDDLQLVEGALRPEVDGWWWAGLVGSCTREGGVEGWQVIQEAGNFLY
jgi:hypothetical protein